MSVVMREKGDYLEKLKRDYERNRKIKGMLDSGRTLSYVAGEFGVSLGVPNYIKHNYSVVQTKLENKIKNCEWIAYLYTEGYRETEIADLEGMTKQNVSRILKQLGIPRESGGKSVIKKRNVVKVKRLAEKGYVLQDIAKITGLEVNLVRQYAYDARVKIRTETTEKVKKLKKEVIELREKGYSQDDIGEKLDISQNYVSKILLTSNLRSKGTPEELLERDADLYRKFKSGNSIAELAEEFKTSEINVRRIVHKMLEIENSP